jgi:hypothetical protein
VTSHELLVFNLVWLGLQAWELLLWLRARSTVTQFARAISGVVATAATVLIGGVVLLTVAGAQQRTLGRE